MNKNKVTAQSVSARKYPLHSFHTPSFPIVHDGNNKQATLDIRLTI